VKEVTKGDAVAFSAAYDTAGALNSIAVGQAVFTFE